jgi:hypothetical protein
MTYSNSLTVSRQLASDLLAAWECGDLTGLRMALDQAGGTDETALDSAEQERMEMIHEVSRSIHGWLRGARQAQTELKMALVLLRHLATVEEPRCRKAAPLERHVFAQR